MTKPLLLLLPGLMCDAAVWQGQAEAFGDAYDVRIPSFHGLDSFDAMANAPGGPLGLYGLWHFNDKGNALIAGLVAAALKEPR